jgi:hypothetical protein
MNMSDKKILPKDLVLKKFNVFIGFGDFVPEILDVSEIKSLLRDELHVFYPEHYKHPTEQYEFISKEFPRWQAFLNSNNVSHVVIYTQSPYVLTTFNNLIMRHEAGEDGGLNFDDVGCWDFNADKTFTDLMNYDLKLISGNTIDKASDVIGEEFHRYMMLAWDKEERERESKEVKAYWYC